MPLPDRTTTAFAFTPATEVALVDLDLILQWTFILNARRHDLAQPVIEQNCRIHRGRR